MGRLTRKVGVVALGRAANVLAMYAMYGLAARTWDKAQCEVFAAMWVLSNALVPIFSLGLPTAVLYFFPRRDDVRGLALQGMGTALLAALLLGGILCALGLSLLSILHGEDGLPPGIEEPLALFIPYAVALVAGGVCDALLVAAERAHWQAALNMGTALGLVGAAALGLQVGLQPAQVLGLISLVGLLRLVAAYALVYRALGAGQWRAGEGWSALLAYSRPIALNDAVGALSRAVDRMVILYFFTHDVFAEYHFGAVEVPISLLLAAVVSVLVPEVSRLYQSGQMQAIARLWRQAVSRLALVALPLFCFLFAFADLFIGCYLPAGYESSVWVFRVFLLSLPLRCAVYNPLLVGMGKASWALWGSLGDLVLNAALSVGLVLWLQGHWTPWAFLGPAMATVMATYLQVFFLVGAIAVHLRWSWSDLLPWSELFHVALAGALAAAAARWVVGWSAAAAWGQLLAGGGVYVLALGAALCCSRSQRQSLRDLYAAIVGGQGTR